MLDPKVEKVTDTLVGDQAIARRDPFNAVDKALDEARHSLREARNDSLAAGLAAKTADETRSNLEAELTEMKASRDTLKQECDDLHAYARELERASEGRRKAMAEHAAEMSKKLERNNLLVARLTNDCCLLQEQRATNEGERRSLEEQRVLLLEDKRAYEIKKRKEEEIIQERHQRASKMLRRAVEALQSLPTVSQPATEEDTIAGEYTARRSVLASTAPDFPEAPTRIRKVPSSAGEESPKTKKKVKRSQLRVPSLERNRK
ncbi:hypothetical protein C8R44DRAFT_31438 [Mycena epipterygia]|nr:hypothetical protein C8R44DRAFT_31438 [Mycena epipterygia]